jgi:3-methyladenine DNA glycosylase AlkC
MKEVENANALKHMFDKAHLKRTADALVAVYPAFERKRYLATFPALEPLPMKSRVRHLRDELQRLLPTPYAKALTLLMKAVKTGKLESFDLWPVTEFIQTYGTDDREISLEALRELTTIFTSEWAVRPFIKKYPKETLKFLLRCTRDSDAGVRRWASEGTRPRLPWGERLQDFVKDPSPTLPILEKLKFDDALFVRKSVANHINDIAKDHPVVAVRLLDKWMGEADPKNQKKIEWIVRRALRTLVKEGHPEALSLLGVSSKVAVQVGKLRLREEKLRMGERLKFSFSVKSLSKQDQKLIIDYRIHFVRANGRPSMKVFKLKTLVLAPKVQVEIEKIHHIKEITTREYYDGLHVIDVQVNGVVKRSGQFVLSGARRKAAQNMPGRGGPRG